MNRLVSVLREVWGLFVEDWTFTFAILVCIGVAALVFPAFVIPVWRGPLLFLLLALVILENSLRSARDRRTPIL